MKRQSEHARRCSGVGTSRQSGNALLVILMIMFLLAAFTAAQVLMFHKNIRQSNFFATHSALRSYASSGVKLAIHDLSYEITGNEGRIGTIGWSLADDAGADGILGTADYGEGDLRPTLGEPNLTPTSVGLGDLGGDLLVYTEDTSWPRVKRIVSSVTRGDTEAVVEVFVEEADNSIPRVGAIYVEPDSVLDLNGNVYTIDGADTNPDGSAGTESALVGIATSPGDPPGDNETALSDQISGGQTDQINGAGGNPSVGESSTVVDVESLYQRMIASVDQVVPPGSYSEFQWGTPDDYQVTHVQGDLDLSGKGRGSGVLIVDGNLTMSGQSEFEGLVIVRGTVDLTGGGQGIHIYGGLFVGDDLVLSGNADLVYSNEALTNVEAMLARHFTIIYWRTLK